METNLWGRTMGTGGTIGLAHPVPSPGAAHVIGTYPVALRARPAAGSPLLLAHLQGGKMGVRVLGGHPQIDFFTPLLALTHGAGGGTRWDTRGPSPWGSPSS